MEDTVPMCKSSEHLECERYVEGIAFQEQRKKSHQGCTFLRNDLCGHPDVWVCKGSRVAFILKGKLMGKTYDSDITPCKGSEWGECPNYVEGIALRKEVQKMHDEKEVKKQQAQ